MIRLGSMLRLLSSDGSGSWSWMWDIDNVRLFIFCNV